MMLVAILAAAAVPAIPTAQEIQAFETARVITPLVARAKDGRRYVEFAPVVETRDVTCAAADAPRVFHCVYEARVRDALSREFGPWQTHEEMVRPHPRAGWVRARE